MKLIRSIILMLLIALSCSKNDNPSLPEESNEAVAVKLQFPLNNSECTTGVDQGADRILVGFQWAIAENDLYELVVENLSTNQISRTNTSNNSAEVQLEKNTPYQWYVVSSVSTSNSKIESERWKFYVAGQGISNYAPFPADLISPEEGANYSEDVQQLILEWQSSDIDDESISYDVFVGSENPPVEMVASDLVEPTFEFSTQLIGQKYWQIVTRDASGNSSYSKVGAFGIGDETGFISFEIQENGTTYSAVFEPESKEIRIQLGNFQYEKLAPQIVMKEGYSVNPASGEMFNFHDDLFYIVTDPKGNETRYDVIIESGQHEVESFKVQQGNEIYHGIINSETATITIEMGNFDYTNVTPIIELSNRATVEVSEVAPMDLTTPATFTVVSEIGTSKEFTVRAPIGMSRLISYFRNPGFEFSDAGWEDIGYKVFAGSTQYIYATNVQDRGQVTIELVNSSGNTFPLNNFRSSYFHQHSLETSSSTNSFNTVIPTDLPAGIYTLMIIEGSRIKTYPQQMEVINDDRVIRINSINKTDFVRGDTLVMTGVNLRKEFMVKTDGEFHTFNEYVYDLELNQDSTELRLPISNNTYNRLKSWGGTNEKPLAIQRSIEGYDYKLNSNVIYFNVN